MMQSVAVISPQSFNTFGALLRYLRERLELSQKELAIQVGYHYSYMSRIEKNQRIPDLQTLMTRFIPALALEDQPQWTARLLELASATRGAEAGSLPPPPDNSPATTPPPTALPIFDLSLSNLPIFLTPLIGRAAEVLALTELLARSDVRLVTLMGPPGVGKTRLAAHLAAQLAGTFAHGPLFVDMTPVLHPNEFLPTLAQALGVVETADAPLSKNLMTALRQRNMLLVIDNFEHIVQAAAMLPNLLMSAPGLKILATSREALHISGEHEFSLAPLALPQETSQPGEKDFESIARIATVQLFAQRAQAVQPNFALTPENLPAVVEVCRRLDGLPLAIELAAARVKTLTPQSMLQQLDRRLEWLTRGSRDALKQTLRGAIEWSYNLLSEQERRVLSRLSVFVDGCTLRAAESVCADAEDVTSENAVPRGEILNVVMALIDKSLVLMETTRQQVRYRLLETVAEFCREKLAQSGEQDEILVRHLKHFTEYAEEAESHLDGTEQGKWIRIADKEHCNFSAALDHALENPEVLEYGLRIGAALSLFWLERNHFQEGIERLNALLEKATAPEHHRARAKMLYRSAAIQTRTQNLHTAYKLCEQSIELARTLGDARILASALYYLGAICIITQEYQKARALLEESIALCWEHQFPTQLTIALTHLGKVFAEQGDTERALASAGEALTIAERAADTWGLSHVLQFLGSLHHSLGERELAIQYLERCLPQTREIGDRFTEGLVLSNLAILHNLNENYSASGHAAEGSFIAFQAIGDEVQQPFPLRMMGYSAIHAGNLIRARSLIRDSLKGNHGLEHLTGQLACLIALGACEFAQGNTEKAVSFAALVEKRVSTESITLMEPDAFALGKLLTAGKSALGGKSFKQVVEKSRDLRVEDILANELPTAA